MRRGAPRQYGAGAAWHRDSRYLAAKGGDAAAPTYVALFLKGDPALELYVVGHTDSTGPVAANVELSERRAAAAAQALVERYDIAARRLTPKGVGPFAPVGTNQTEDGRAKNRRVELVDP